MTRRAAALGGLLLVAGLLGAVTGCQPRQDGELEVVRLVVQQRFSNIPLLLADAKGHFRRHGIRIERIPLERGSEALPLLIRGRVDAAAMATTVNLLSAVERGAHIRIVANKGYYPADHCAQSALVARADWAPPAGETELREYVRGRKIAIANSTGTSFLISRVLDSIGLAERDVDIVGLPDAAKLDALANGQVDLAHLGEPDVARSRARGFVVWRSSEQVMPGLDQAYIVVASRLYERDRELGARFLAAYLEGVTDYLGGKSPENVAVVALETGLEPSLIRDSCWPAIRADGRVHLETLRLIGAWAVERGLLERAPAAERLVDLGLLAEARRRVAGTAP